MDETTVNTDTSSQDDSATSVESDSKDSVQASTEQAQQTESQGTTNEESFFDPKQVPEELIPAYKQMQADYTKKTQAMAEERRQAEEWKSKADAYAKYENYVPIIDEMLAPAQTADSTPEMAVLEQQLKNQGYGEDAIQMMKMGAKVIMDSLNHREQVKLERTQQEQTLTALNSKITEAENVDPRLKDENLSYQMDDGSHVKFGEIVAQMVTANPQWRQDPIAATKRAIKVVDAMMGKAKVEGKEELSNSAMSKAQRFPSLNTSPQSATRNSKPKTITEAYEEASKEHGW